MPKTYVRVFGNRIGIQAGDSGDRNGEISVFVTRLAACVPPPGGEGGRPNVGQWASAGGI